MMLRRSTQGINMKVILIFVALLPVAFVAQLLIGVAFEKWSDRSGDYSLDSYETYAVGNIIDAMPSDFSATPTHMPGSSFRSIMSWRERWPSTAIREASRAPRNSQRTVLISPLPRYSSSMRTPMSRRTAPAVRSAVRGSLAIVWWFNGSAMRCRTTRFRADGCRSTSTPYRG